MSTTVELENRRCVKCERTFRVMTKSPTVYCSTECKEFITPVRGAHQKASIASDKPKTLVSVEIGELTKRKSSPEERRPFPLNPWPKNSKYKNDLNNEIEPTIKETRSESMREELNGQEKTNQDNLKIKGPITEYDDPSDYTRFTPTETKPTQPESSEKPLKSIRVASSDILNLSKRSAERLMTLMEEAVNESDLTKSKEGTQRVELHRIDTAIRCANSITQIVQANVNLLKALKK